MSKILAGSRYLVLIAVLALLISTLAAFGWGIAKTVEAVGLVFSTLGKDPGIIIALVEVVDAFLVATALLIFALGLYEISIGPLNLPGWMVVHNLYDLKARLGSLLVLVMAVKFLEKLAAWKDGQGTLFFAIAIGIISAVLIAFSQFGGQD